MSLDQDSIILFSIFVVPGLVSMTVYRMLMPARQLRWGDALIQGLFYSILNFILLFPALLLITDAGFRAGNLIGTWLVAVACLGVAPTIWPFVLRKLYRWEWLAQKIQIPYPTAWDYFFDLRDPTFVLIHLRNGSLLGGYWGPRSYAGSFPNHGDIYLEAVYKVDPEGKFGEPMPDTNGVLLRRDEYTYFELFKLPVGGSENG